MDSRPAYVLQEKRLRENLELIRSVSEQSGAEIILAFKAYALWKTFPVFREYIRHSTASSIFEARMAYEEFGSRAHTFSPAYTRDVFEELMRMSSHITFNSLSQYERMKDFVLSARDTSFGLRINPEYSVVETDLYNPCAPGSRLGIPAVELPLKLPEGIEGLHFHSLCEGSAEDLRNTLAVIEERFSVQLERVKWLNMGGGHLMTRQGYDVDLLIKTLREFAHRHPHLQLIMEPGSAFGWQTGYLKSHVVDVVKHQGIRTALVDVSFTCHMPDCLEMPYYPAIRGAEHTDKPVSDAPCYRIGGNSCLSGDFMEYWTFGHELQVGEPVIFEDMLHYTTVKTNMFNGIPHPDIWFERMDGRMELLRRYEYDDYKNRMD